MSKVEVEKAWTLYTDGASSSEGAGAGVILTSPTGERSTYALRFGFKCSNNEAEYEATLAGLRLAQSLKVKKIAIFSDSLLVVNQVNGTYEAKEAHIRKYLERVHKTLLSFESYTITQVPRSQNKEADALSKLASVVFEHLTKEILVEILPVRSTEATVVETFSVQEQEKSWMTPFIEYLQDGVLPENKVE